jgi:hypothetical protein
MSWADNTNAAFGHQLHITPDLVIVPTTTDPVTSPYTNGGTNTLTFTLGAGGPPFSMTQEMRITLGPNSLANLTITTRALTTNPVPEPSTLAVAGLGALGFMGYGLRRRLRK